MTRSVATRPAFSLIGRIDNVVPGSAQTVSSNAEGSDTVSLVARSRPRYTIRDLGTRWHSLCGADGFDTTHAY